MPKLELSQFTCEREGYPLFRPLSLSVQGGEVVQISGPNGAGKTTTLRALGGLYSEWTGDISWNGNSARVPDYDMRCQLLYLGHQTGVKRSLTARENLSWYFGIHGRAFPGRVEDALAAVGLAGYEDIPCQQMSAGQNRRVALARLYVTEAPVWILDEPFTAIDRAGVAKLETLIVGHASKGGLIILTTHQPLAFADLKIVELETERSGAA